MRPPATDASREPCEGYGAPLRALLLVAVLAVACGGPEAGGGPDAEPGSGADAGGLPGDGGTAPQVRFAFQSRRAGNSDVWMTPGDGGSPEPLTTAPSEELFPAWSPDGRWLAFASDREGPYQLYVRDLAGSAPEVRLETGLYSATAPSFSPDGQWLAFEGRASTASNADIYRVRVAEGRVLGPPGPLTSAPGPDVQPVWGPDGQSLYFVSPREGAFDVWVMGADGSAQRRLTTRAGVLGRPAVSPRGDALAYAQWAGERSRVVVQPLGTGGVGEPRVLSDQDDSEPAFSPDGRWLAVTSLRGGDAEVLLLETDGGAVVARLTHHPAVDGAAVLAPEGAP